MTEIKKILSEWQKGDFKPVYWFEGDEEFVIDRLLNYAEKNILSEEQATFNLTVYYGRDADWPTLLNTLRKYPIFGDKQLVLLKEAQMMRDLDKIEPYLQNPLPSTVFVIGYKGKPDGRLKFSKTVAATADVHKFSKLRDDKLPDWIKEQAKDKGIKISEKGVMLLKEQIGNDLSRLSNELDKLSLNISKDELIDENIIEKFTGISKEYNTFELVDAVCKKDLGKCLKIANYFAANPKAGNLHSTLPNIYSQISKAYVASFAKDKSDNTLKAIFGGYFQAIQGKDALKNYSQAQLQNFLLLIHHYNLKALGVEDNSSPQDDLMKEFLIKVMMN